MNQQAPKRVGRMNTCPPLMVYGHLLTASSPNQAHRTLGNALDKRDMRALPLRARDLLKIFKGLMVPESPVALGQVKPVGHYPWKYCLDVFREYKIPFM